MKNLKNIIKEVLKEEFNRSRIRIGEKLNFKDAKGSETVYSIELKNGKEVYPEHWEESKKSDGWDINDIKAVRVGSSRKETSRISDLEKIIPTNKPGFSASSIGWYDLPDNWWNDKKVVKTYSSEDIYNILYEKYSDGTFSKKEWVNKFKELLNILD